jgi:NAD(P)-dependent dehydrogenase (short-subunit alcohol dehydrogenase family)
MAGRLEGKIALVTGGSSGIGRASALTFAREGAKVVVADVDVEGGEGTAQMIEKNGGEALFIKTDVSKGAEVEALVKGVIETHGKLDCAFNNAGIESSLTSTVKFTEEEWDRVMGINLKGVWLCMKYEIPQMLQNGGGAIVNTSSVAGLVGTPGVSAYAASKHGVIGLTKTAALEYARRGIRINAVCPGWIHTAMVERSLAEYPEMEKQFVDMEPVGRMGMPAEIAEAVVWLCSDAASFVTGHAMAVDGGAVAQ